MKTNRRAFFGQVAALAAGVVVPKQPVIEKRRGLSPSLRTYHYAQVLQRFNDAIALDYVVPFRVIRSCPPSSQIV